MLIFGSVDRPHRSDCTAGQMDGEAGWWTTSGKIGIHPLARAMGVGRQQQHPSDDDLECPSDTESDYNCHRLMKLASKYQNC